VSLETGLTYKEEYRRDIGQLEDSARTADLSNQVGTGSSGHKVFNDAEFEDGFDF
jgi:hypothetical protein